MTHTELQKREVGHLTQMEWRRAGEEEEVTLEMSHKDQYELDLEDE